LNACLIPLLILLPLPGLADWRRDLLEAQGIGTTEAALREATSGGAGIDLAALGGAYAELGSERYPERERAQSRILAMGPEVLGWLRKQPLSPNPEIRARVAEIHSSLTSTSGDLQPRMVNHAARTLLEEAGGKADPTTGGIFYEWFGLANGAVGERWRSFHFAADEGMKGRVEDNTLILDGNRPGDGDQRLELRAAEWPGGDIFPDSFTVSTRLGGTAGGGGAWHLGVSVGRVRALYHPGYPGGGFRFEQVGTAKELTQNTGMGFSPSTSEPQSMTLRVRRLNGGAVELRATVRQEGSKPFEASYTVPADTIGRLDRISLDRSGRTGGDARFSHLQVELGPR
jgi:hypothetical protein